MSKSKTPSKTLQNQRQFTRVDAEIKVITEIGAKILIHGVTKDISVKGAYISCYHGFKVGVGCKVSFYLGDENKPHSLGIDAYVVRVEKEGLAVEFKGMQIKDLEDLKSIILYNSSEPHLVREEFEEAHNFFSL